MEKTDHAQAVGGEAEILQSWHGDYPVSRLDLLPDDQREQGVGFIDDVETFEDVWRAFKPVTKTSRSTKIVSNWPDCSPPRSTDKCQNPRHAGLQGASISKGPGKNDQVKQ